MELIRRPIAYLLLGAVVWLVAGQASHSAAAAGHAGAYTVAVLIAAAGFVLAAVAFGVLIWTVVRPGRR